MSDASDFLKKWVSKTITPTTAHFHSDTLTVAWQKNVCGRLREKT
jgi:hypothetical protein